MKEIDFLPEWYKAGKRLKASYRRQYLVVAGVMLAMLVWGLSTSYSVSAARGQVSIIKESLAINGPIGKRCGEYQLKIEDLKEQKKILDKLGQHTTMSSIMAELSYLCDDRIRIDKFTVVSESFRESMTGKAKVSVRISSGATDGEPDLLELDLRMKVNISGLASDSSGVGSLISKLEQSDYFCHIVPGYSRPKAVGDKDVTEFEISFYVANYTLEGSKIPRAKP